MAIQVYSSSRPFTRDPLPSVKLPAYPTPAQTTRAVQLISARRGAIIAGSSDDYTDKVDDNVHFYEMFMQRDNKHFPFLDVSSHGRTEPCDWNAVFRRLRQEDKLYIVYGYHFTEALRLEG